jgi:hypothetical protein
MGRTQFFGMPTQKGRRILAQIYGHIPNYTANTRHELSFGFGRILKVHAANRARHLGERMVDLADWPFPSGGAQLLRTKHTREKSSLVANRLALNDSKTFQLGALNYKSAHAAEK